MHERTAQQETGLTTTPSKALQGSTAGVVLGMRRLSSCRTGEVRCNPLSNDVEPCCSSAHSSLGQHTQLVTGGAPHCPAALTLPTEDDQTVSNVQHARQRTHLCPQEGAVHWDSRPDVLTGAQTNRGRERTNEGSWFDGGGRAWLGPFSAEGSSAPSLHTSLGLVNLQMWLKTDANAHLQATWRSST